MWTGGFYWYGHVYGYRKQEFQTILEKEIMQLLWTAVTYLLKKMFEHDIDITYGFCVN